MYLSEEFFLYHLKPYLNGFILSHGSKLLDAPKYQEKKETYLTGRSNKVKTYSISVGSPLEVIGMGRGWVAEFQASFLITGS